MNNPVDQPKVSELTEAGVRSILESLGDDTFAGCERRSTMSVRQQRALCNLALSALIVNPGAEYTPAILEMDREGDPCWEFVERDCLTVTGVVFAANVEQLFDADHQLIGFRIFKPSAGPGAEKGEAVYSQADFDESYEIGKRDGYEEAIQDLDLATGGDGEFKGSTFPGETVDVPVMKARIIERFEPLVPTSDAEKEEPVAWRGRVKFSPGQNGWQYAYEEQTLIDRGIHERQPLYAAPTSERVQALEIGWLIELVSRLGLPPTWFALGGDDDNGFTADSIKALRFARKQDAQAYIDDIGWTECIPTEHEWSDPSPKAVARRAALLHEGQG